MVTFYQYYFHWDPIKQNAGQVVLFKESKMEAHSASNLRIFKRLTTQLV